MIVFSLHDFSFTLNEVLTFVKKNELNASEDDHEVKVTLLPPSEDGLTDQGLVDSDNEVTGRFLLLPRSI